MTNDRKRIGIARAVLLFGKDTAAKAVISDVIACRMQARGRQRVRFTGTVQFSNPVRKHIRSIVVRIVDRILSELQLPAWGFEISATNLGAASALDVGVRISGLSADVAVFLALLSAGLQIPVAGDVVATGHIASVSGDIRAVKGLPAKVQAAAEDGTIRRFLHPDLDQDRSMQTLSPAERERGITAVMGVRDLLKTRVIGGIDEVIKEIFSEGSVVLASLNEGFFATSTQCRCDSPVANVIGFLTQDNTRRFWRVLEQCFLAGQCERGKRLLGALVDFLIARRSYGSGMGAKLFNLMCSVPPSVRRLKIEFPLVDTALCIRLADFAGRADHEDVLKLLDAVHGKGMVSAASGLSTNQPSVTSTSDTDCTAFDTVVSQISEDVLARRLGIGIDSARGSFILDSSTVQSPDEFHEVLNAFYCHLHCWISCRTEESLDADRVRTETIDLLEKAFRNRGGERAAYVRARDGTQGGMRSILDAVAEQYKRDRYAAHVQRVLCEAISAMDWDDRVAFMQTAMRRLGPFLPPELRDEPPERFVRQYEVIVQTYVESLDKLGQLFRTL